MTESSVRRFTYPWWQRLFGRAPRYGWRVACWRCGWVAVQPEHKRGLWRQYLDHAATHGS